MARGATVLILVGPKGSGKTFIGSSLSRELGVPFLRVEPIFLEVLRNSRLDGVARDAEGFGRVRAELERRLANSPCVAMESTGASDAFAPFLGDLRSRYRLLLVSVRAPPERCLERVRTRDQREHIPVSDDRVLEINRHAAAVELAWDLVIDNSGPAPVEAILEALRRLLAGHPGAVALDPTERSGERPGGPRRGRGR